MPDYTFTLNFPTDASQQEVVTNLDFQVTSDPPTLPQLQLPKNTMPQLFFAGDTIKFTYNQDNSDEINSCLFTLYPLRDTIYQKQYMRDGKEQITDFNDLFDKPINITPAFRGTWIFHLLGMYTNKAGTKFSFYLDPEASCG